MVNQTLKDGRSPAEAGSGLRPFGVEPAAPSQAEPLVPNAVFVVIRVTGEYSDRGEEPVVAFPDRESAKAFVLAARAQFDEAMALCPPPRFDSSTDEAYGKFKAALAHRTIAARKIAFLDPDAICADGYEDRPYYHEVEVPFASGMSAGAAETAEQAQGQRPASPVGAAETPNTSQGPNP